MRSKTFIKCGILCLLTIDAINFAFGKKYEKEEKSAERSNQVLKKIDNSWVGTITKLRKDEALMKMKSKLQQALLQEKSLEIGTVNGVTINIGAINQSHIHKKSEGCNVPRDCSEIKSNISGPYVIQPTSFVAPFIVYCDQETDGGGWIVFQRRFNGELDFYKGWKDYQYGFGNIAGEHWMGLEKLFYSTYFQVNELYVELEDFENNRKYARYDAFGIGSDIEEYRISLLGTYEGTAGDSLSGHAGYKFSTLDRDNDESPWSCAEAAHGAWWYNNCHTSNLNGAYLRGATEEYAKGMCWLTFRGHYYSLKTSKMMIRPRRNK